MVYDCFSIYCGIFVLYPVVVFAIIISNKAANSICVHASIHVSFHRLAFILYIVAISNSSGGTYKASKYIKKVHVSQRTVDFFKLFLSYPRREWQSFFIIGLAESLTDRLWCLSNSIKLADMMFFFFLKNFTNMIVAN